MRVIFSALVLPALALASAAISSDHLSPSEVMPTSNIDMDTVTVIVTVPAYASTPASVSLNNSSTISVVEPPVFTSLPDPTMINGSLYCQWPIEDNETHICSWPLGYPTMTTPGGGNDTITLTSTIFRATSSATMPIDHTESMTSSAVTTQSTGGTQKVMKLGSLALIAGGLVAALV